VAFPCGSALRAQDASAAAGSVASTYKQYLDTSLSKKLAEWECTTLRNPLVSKFLELTLEELCVCDSSSWAQICEQVCVGLPEFQVHKLRDLLGDVDKLSASAGCEGGGGAGAFHPTTPAERVLPAVPRPAALLGWSAADGSPRRGAQRRQPRLNGGEPARPAR